MTRVSIVLLLFFDQNYPLKHFKPMGLYMAVYGIQIIFTGSHCISAKRYKLFKKFNGWYYNLNIYSLYERVKCSITVNFLRNSFFFCHYFLIHFVQTKITSSFIFENRSGIKEKHSSFIVVSPYQ